MQVSFPRPGLTSLPPAHARYRCISTLKYVREWFYSLSAFVANSPIRLKSCHAVTRVVPSGGHSVTLQMPFTSITKHYGSIPPVWHLVLQNLTASRSSIINAVAYLRAIFFFTLQPRLSLAVPRIQLSHERPPTSAPSCFPTRHLLLPIFTVAA